MLEQGEVESSSNIDVNCEVKAKGTSGTPILWVIDEGTYVKKGDKLVELDASAFEDELTTQRIAVSGAESTVISSDALVRTAEIALRVPRRDLSFGTQNASKRNRFERAESTQGRIELSQRRTHGG